MAAFRGIRLALPSPHKSLVSTSEQGLALLDRGVPVRLGAYDK
jgi:hypothetical protein